MVRKIFKVYAGDYRFPSIIYIGLFSLWFSENYLAFGPGWDKWWLLAWVIHWVIFLIIVIRKKDDRKPFFAWAFILCNVLQFGGCHAYNRLVPTLPEEKECTFQKYNRFILGRYSDCIPVGARNIKFRYYDGLFSGRSVECQVSKEDFLWFCWRNGYTVRKGSRQINERTGKPMTTSWFGYEPKEGKEDYYSYFDVAETCAGVKLLYDIKNETLHLSWSTN